MRAPIVGSQRDVDDLHRKAAARNRAYVAELVSGSEGVLIKGTSQGPIPPGRFRLHIPLALAPLGDQRVRSIAITIKADDTTRDLTMLHFVEPERFTDFTVDFKHERGEINFEVAWALTSEDAERDDIKTTKAPKAPTLGGAGDLLDESAPGDDPFGELEATIAAPETKDDGSISLDEAAKVELRLLARTPVLEMLSPVAVLDVRTNKVVYRPGEAGTVAATLSNGGAVPVRVRLSATLSRGLGEPAALGDTQADITVPAKGMHTWSADLPASDVRWGGEVRVTATPLGEHESLGAHTNRDVFTVADNLFEVAVMAGQSTIGTDLDDIHAARRYVNQWRREGYTGFEAFFWAPCDMLDFTPDTEVFFGGQHGYRASITSTKNLVAAAHENGIAATVYANMYGGSGLPALDLQRKHPEWFGTAVFRGHIVDDLPLLQEDKMRTGLFWVHNLINADVKQEVLAYHADEMIESHRIFGWDGTRYDSFYPKRNPWLKDATAFVRQRVETAIPNYRWGYNSIVTRDVVAGALPIMVKGGGLIMNEGIARITENGGPIAGYSKTLSMHRDLIWHFDGHSGVIYSTGGKEYTNLLDEVYMSSIMLATGSHPYYARLESQLGDLPLFARRYGEFIYDHHMKPLDKPEQFITFDELPGGRQWHRWQPLARTVDLGGGRHRLVLHLINLDPRYRIKQWEAMKTPTVVKDHTVRITLPDGAKATGAWQLSARPEPMHTSLPIESGGKQVALTVDEVRFWKVIVLEFESDTALPSLSHMEGFHMHGKEWAQ